MNLVEQIESLRTPLKVIKVEYADLGVLKFTLDNGSTWRIKEPMDVLLVEQPLHLVNRWAQEHYGLFL